MGAPITIHPELKAHDAKMEQKIVSLNGYIHTACAYSPANMTMIEGDDGVILVDTLPTIEFAKPVAEELKKITDKPIKAIIYTHVHPDHISGVRAFISEEDVQAGNIEIIALDDLIPAMVRDNGVLAPVLARRAMYAFGFQLPLNDEGNVSAGLGPPNIPGQRSFIAPTKTFSGIMKTKICGIEIELHHVPSETDDQVIVWLPKDKVLISADVIQGQTFPNLYALRGTSFRDPMIWVDGIDHLRRMEPETLIPHHGIPVVGADNIEDVLVAYRDSIQYLHDQTVRRMNHGYTPEEIREEVIMPDHLAEHEWLGEFYGSYKHSAPAIYDGYVGWFDGDPIHLDPKPRSERAENYVELMGGREQVLAKAKLAFDEGDFQWAAEIVTWIIKANTSDVEARELKAKALRLWAYDQKNITWRNWALTTSLELEGKLKAPKGLPFGGPDAIRNFPSKSLLRLLTVRLRAEDCKNLELTSTFNITDTNEICALEIRRGVCQFHPDAPKSEDIRINCERNFLTRIFLGQTTYQEGITDGSAQLEGDQRDFDHFMSLFEQPSLDLAITVR